MKIFFLILILCITTQCVLTKICRLPKVIGPCRAKIPRYFYNRLRMRCELFTYGGCRGNSNNFRSLKACQARCNSTRRM